MEEPWDQRRNGTEPDDVETDSHLDQYLVAQKQEKMGQKVVWKFSQLLHYTWMKGSHDPNQDHTYSNTFT